MRPRGRRTWRGLAAATLLPGVAAGTFVGLLPEEGSLSAPVGPSAPALARLADLPPPEVPPQTRSLQPVVPVKGRLRVGAAGLERLAGGIRPARPGWIRIPDAGVSAGVGPVRARRGGIEVPPDGHTGWYSGGARPGEPGRAVVIGHLDTKKGPGVFEKVPKLDRGDAIEITDDRGAVHRYSVVGLTRVRKSRFPTRAVYGHARNPVLVLVTCGGPYRPGRGYRDNVLVYARSA